VKATTASAATSAAAQTTGAGGSTPSGTPSGVKTTPKGSGSTMEVVSIALMSTLAFMAMVVFH